MQYSYSSWLQPALPPLHKIMNIKSELSNLKTQTLSRNSSSECNGINDEEDDDNPGVVKFSLPSHVKSITSTSNPFIKHCVKLRHSSSYRHAHGSVLVVGTTPIREIYNFEKSSQGRTAETDLLLLLDNVKVPEGLDDASVRTVRVSSLVMKKLSKMQSTESIEAAALMKIPTTYFVIDHNQKEVDYRSLFQSPSRILVLDGVQDPGNLGTLIRSTMAFNWDGVFLLPGCCDPFNEKALRASRGACFQLPLVSATWHHLEALKHEFQMKLLAGHSKYDEDDKPVSFLSQALVVSLENAPLCLVLGSEGHGLSEESKRLCELISIPMPGEFESLNVSVAGGIFLYMLRPGSQRSV